MLVNPSKSRTANDFSPLQVQALDRAAQDIRIGKIGPAGIIIEKFVSEHFDFTKSIDPQVEKYMKYVSSKYLDEKGTIEKMMSAALAIHESTESMSVND